MSLNCALKIFERLGDRDFEKFDSEIAREAARVIDAAARRVRARHGNAGHVLSAERIDRDDRDDCGIDSAAQTEHRGMEVAFAPIIAKPE